MGGVSQWEVRSLLNLFFKMPTLEQELRERNRVLYNMRLAGVDPRSEEYRQVWREIVTLKELIAR